jgi:hypothetical protein
MNKNANIKVAGKTFYRVDHLRGWKRVKPREQLFKAVPGHACALDFASFF